MRKPLLLPIYKWGKQGSEWGYIKISFSWLLNSFSLDCTSNDKILLSPTLLVNLTVVGMSWAPDIKTHSIPPGTHLPAEGDELPTWNSQGSPVTPHLSLTGEWAVRLSGFYRWHHRTQKSLRNGTGCTTPPSQGHKHCLWVTGWQALSGSVQS